MKRRQEKINKIVVALLMVIVILLYNIQMNITGVSIFRLALNCLEEIRTAFIWFSSIVEEREMSWFLSFIQWSVIVLPPIVGLWYLVNKFLEIRTALMGSKKKISKKKMEKWLSYR
ncbi:hypothetical protein ABER99_21710 [Paenibacillus glucanolyticus]|uniref:Uncharacterized protein n=1 Tax=Paenibacillus glucanolyticus TaxID=59843 RepID=A0A163GRG2_9BACL|nr:hypothetical protein [Paenibacillus glucanolyticus]KZS45111.1 hypothetical protein AWU65_03780 [Paenibacillus glucanolyticus]OMF63859.1 hypothetical protein BK142_32470 [Paenibacillus glucanolyticus]